MKNYNYPIDPEWSNEEIVAVITFLNAIELAYEGGVQITQLRSSYDKFKEVVPSKSEEKQLGNKFENLSGYSIYRTIQEMRKRLKENQTSKKAQIIKMNT